MAKGRPDAKQRSTPRVSEVVVLTTAMLTFISFWRAASIVLCDMASTAWYIGGIAEQAIGKSAPWFILGVMAFSACMLAVYVEASSMFIRGGVYTVVKSVMGDFLAKVSVSALVFSYVLTGPISAVSAGQYLAGLLNSLLPIARIPWSVDAHAFSMAFAILITLYVWRQNIRGIEESSEKASAVIKATAVMAVFLFAWSAYTLYARGFERPPFSIDFGEHALGWLEGFDWARSVGAFGVLVGLGHAFLGMSGLESLAQVYREMEAPKLENLKKAAATVFCFAFVLTTTSSFLAVTIIPDDVRARYLDNLLGGLAMAQEGPHWARLVLQAAVVLVGAAILSGAVNTAVVGSNGVLNRLAEDGVLADWFRWLHPRYGTTHRTINLVVGLQVFTIVACRGEVYLLGEAYAFGVIWSFVFMTASMVMLRFKDREERDWKVPLNIRLPSGVEFPVGMSLILLVLVAVAVTNLLTKKIATVWGVAFTVGFYLVIHLSDRMNQRKRAKRDHREKLNLRHETEVQGVIKELDKPERVLVAIKNPSNVHVLDQVLEGVDPDTTDVVVMHSKIAKSYMLNGEVSGVDPESELLFTNVIALAEKHGKPVVPLLLVSNDPSYAVSQAAQAVGAKEIVMGVSGLIRPEDQIERLAMTLGALGYRPPKPIKVRVLWAGGKRMEAEL